MDVSNLQNRKRQVKEVFHGVWKLRSSAFLLRVRQFDTTHFAFIRLLHMKRSEPAISLTSMKTGSDSQSGSDSLALTQGISVY